LTEIYPFIVATKFSTCIWSEFSAKEMSNYYQSVFADFLLISENPMAVVFEVAGIRLMCLNNGNKNEVFNEKISFVLSVDTQEEIDHYWNYFTRDGKEGQCGWLQDKYGISWQIVPSILGKLMTNPETAPKATYAFMQMSKFDIAKLNAEILR
jgi:predicted 3-demethylubiquinone-9 3-methyltransferase (glyoxalase superfamily)